jgi:hypothetical protein
MTDQPRAWIYYEDGRLEEVEEGYVGVADMAHYEDPNDPSTLVLYCRNRIYGTPHLLYVLCSRDPNALPAHVLDEVRRRAAEPPPDRAS